MISLAPIKTGDLFLVNFSPSEGHEYQGMRPALVVQSDVQIAKSNLISVLPLTSNLDNRTKDDIIIIADGTNRLKYDSVIKVYQIMSFDRSRFVNRIGNASAETMAAVKKYLIRHFAL